MILIYTHTITNRVKYTFHLIFRSVLGIEVELTKDAERFKTHQGPKLSYTTRPLSNELFFESSDILFETGISPKATPFDTAGSKEPKDLFCCSFFMATRYEEYISFVADNYGRFSAAKSLAYKHNSLKKPMINIWANEIRQKLAVRYPNLIFPKKKYTYTPTIDIDNAYAYLGKSLARTLGGYARAAAMSDSDDFLRRRNVMTGKERDPYDTYDYQLSLHKKYNLSPIYFFLLGDWAENDKNLPHSSPVMQSLIKKIALNADTGIHPSFASNQNPEKVVVEKKRLSEITQQPVTKSRQHFLKLRFPETYRGLIAAGITDDYTMGFAEEVGFRAGICMPYKWYDLEKEEETDLTIHPFAVMDGTLNNYLKLSPEQAVDKAKDIIKEIKNVNGEFITIWHNETLSNWRDWKGWKEVYEQIIHLAQ